MAKLTPQEAVAKQAARLKGATEDIRRGIDRVSEAPGVKAAAKQDKMLAGITEAVQSGKWAQRVSAVTLEEWKRKTRDVGVNRIAAGIDAAQPKMLAFYEQLIPFQENLQREVGKMPDITLEDNLARMTTFVRGMSQFRFKR